MPPPLQIEFTSKGLKAIMADLKKTATIFKSLSASGPSSSISKGASALVLAAKALDKSGDKLINAAKEIQKAAKALNAAKAGGSTAAAAAASAPPKVPPLPKAPKVPPLPALPSGPRQQLARLKQQRVRAVGSGNQDAVDDIDDRIARLQKGLGTPSLGSKIGGLISSSRLSFGGGGGQILPLVSKITALLGPEFTLIAGAASVAAGALYELGTHAAENIVAFSKLSLALGSGTGTTAGLQAAGLAGGFDPAAVGQSINSKITSDPMARAIAAGYGIYNPGGYFGNQDYGAQEQGIIAGLRGEKDPTARLAKARELGATELLPLANLSDKQYSYIEKDKKTTSAIITPEAQQQAADAAAALGRVGAALQNVITALGKPFLNTIINWLNGLANALEGFATWVNNHEAAISAGINALKDAIPGGHAFDNDDSNGPAQAMNDALDKQTDATNANTQAIYKQIGRWGVGARGDSAIPSGVSGIFLHQAMIMGGIGLSQF